MDSGPGIDAPGSDVGQGVDGGPGNDAATPGTDSGTPASGGSVVTHHNGATRDGLYVAPRLTRAAAASMRIDPGFSATIAGPTYAHPLYFDAGAAGTSLVLVATEQNNVYALDANTGRQVWMRNVGAPVPLSSLPCGNINTLGVTGTPTIEAASHTIYLDAMTLVSGAPRHMIHALSIDDGTSRTGWPVDVNAAVTGFDSSVQNQRGALLILGGTLYVPYGGHWGDCGNYHGWLVGVSIAAPGTVRSWATRADGAGSWAPGGVASDGTSLYVTTGNANSSSPGWVDQNAIIRLAPGPTFSMTATDYFAPTNWQALDLGDTDLGGCGPLLVHVAGATPSDLVVALGKDSNAYLINRASMGGIGREITQATVTGNPIITAASAYPTASGVNVVLEARCATGPGDLVAFHISATSPPAITNAWCANEGGRGSPIATTTDGHSESIVWTIGAEGSNALRAFNGDTGAVISSTPVPGTFRRFVSPIFANGRFYVAGNGGVYAIRPM